MKKNTFSFIVLVIILIVSNTAHSATLKTTPSTAPPVELDKGWNLISVPCDIYTSQFIKGGESAKTTAKKENDESDNEEMSENDSNGKGNNDEKDNENANNDEKDNGNDNGNNGNDKDTIFYSWNGSGYDEVTHLNRGVGYIVNTNNIQNTSSVCENGNAVEPMEITLKKGWNLVGNPYHKSYKVDDIFGAAVSSIETIYEYSGNKYSELKNSEHFKPWRGYWVLVGEDVTVPVFITCSLTVSADKYSIEVQTSSVLEAVYSCTAANGDVESYDVLEDVEWTNSNEKAGVVKNGIYVGILEGESDISTSYKDIVSNTINISVKNPPGCDILQVVQIYDEEKNSNGYCGKYEYFSDYNNYYFSFSMYGIQCQECGNSSSVNCWSVSDNGWKYEYTCFGDGYCYWDYIYLEPAPVLWHNPGEISLKAFCIDTSSDNTEGTDYTTAVQYNSYEDVSEKVEWTIDGDKSVLTRNENGVFNGEKTGTARVTVKYSNLVSNEQSVVVIDPDEVLFLSFFPMSYIRVLANGSTDARLYAAYYNIDGECDIEFEFWYGCIYRFEDVTDLASYEYSNDLVTFDSGKVMAGEDSGDTIIKAIYGNQSTNLYVSVISDLLMLVTVEGPYEKLVPECPSFNCYATFVDEPFDLRVYALTTDLTEWISVTDRITWEISDNTVASIDSGGKLTPISAGTMWIRATYGDARSDKVWISVLDDNTNKFLVMGLGGMDFFPMRPLKVGETLDVYTAMYEYQKDISDNCSNYYYNCFPVRFIGYVRPESVVVSDSTIISNTIAEKCGYDNQTCINVTGVKPGFIDMSANYQGLSSNELNFEVWQNENLDRCDSANPNTIVWIDDIWGGSQAILDSDCSTYNSDDTVQIRYTAKVDGGSDMLFDNCLDLWVLDENDNIVKTFRYEGCSNEEIGRSAHKSLETVFQVKYDWDMIGDDGNKVAPGTYYATARFYILYEPVIHLPITINE